MAKLIERDDGVAMVYGVLPCFRVSLVQSLIQDFRQEESLLMAFPSKSNVLTKKQRREDICPTLGTNCGAFMELFRDTGNHGRCVAVFAVSLNLVTIIGAMLQCKQRKRVLMNCVKRTRYDRTRTAKCNGGLPPNRSPKLDIHHPTSRHRFEGPCQ